MASTGWRAASDSRRAHAKQALKKKPPSSKVSKKRRNSAKDSNSALRMKGLLPA